MEWSLVREREFINYKIHSEFYQERYHPYPHVKLPEYQEILKTERDLRF